MMRRAAPLFLLVAAIGLSACGEAEKTEVTNVLVSPERQKADLQRALVDKT
jgi:hypothetical protein